MLRTLSRSLAAVLVAAGLASAAQAAAPEQINISYVKSPFNLQSMVMRKQGLLEKEFEKDGITVVWHDITSGAHQAQAMAAGSLDIGGVMNTTSILLANAGGNPVAIAAGVSRPSQTYAIVARAGGPQSVAELKGAKVAGPRGTVLHQLLAAALAAEGMSLSDVEFLGMDLPKAQASVIAGQVDAALLAASLKIKAEEAGARTIATADGLINPVLVVGVRRAFATDHPELLERVLKVHRDTTAWIAAHADDAIALGAEEQGISLDDARKLAAWSNFTDTLRPDDVASIADDLAFLKANDMLQGEVDIPALLLPGALATTTTTSGAGQ
ncbi:NrtA/SsuA/CpmA family ABC transporter substrate-binding protein [Caenispirillum bisanense]|uniref:NrtA/SsuA/CpmA family ABC transporter substrate-binding protein n=1 Tax=Caenispirillum bisanense TaxID=414052 RepID=UPI0031DDC649